MLLHLPLDVIGLDVGKTVDIPTLDGSVTSGECYLQWTAGYLSKQITYWNDRSVTQTGLNVCKVDIPFCQRLIVLILSK